ncbi:MAG: mercury(II) reductase [Alphaproteobacteria bacterium]
MSERCEPTGPSDRKDYDLAVIGAGSAGFSAAITAAELGAQVALIGDGAIGGTCVNVGCVPSKALIRAAEALHQSRAASRFAGIAGNAKLDDWRALVAQKDTLVGDLRQAKYIDVLPEYNNVAYLEGGARLTAGGVAINGTKIAADKVIIATGSSPSIPPIEGIETTPYLTSTTALELETLPQSMIVVGAGYIGCELAQMFARVGVKVTLVCRSRVLPGSEPEIGEALAGFLRQEGIEVREGLTYRSAGKTGKGVALEVEEKSGLATIEASALLLTTGRHPNISGLGLKEAGIEMTSTGGIKVDARMRTTGPGIYAAGDVTGRDEFVYMAAYGARIAAENALNGDGRAYDASAMPAVVFTDPQVASVGLSEAEARAQGFEVKTSILPLEHVPRALAARDTRGLIKLVGDTASDRLLGAHIIAPEGADSIQTAVIAIKCGMTTKALAETIFPYLTTVEGLKLAAQTFDKDVTKLSCCAG